MSQINGYAIFTLVGAVFYIEAKWTLDSWMKRVIEFFAGLLLHSTSLWTKRALYVMQQGELRSTKEAFLLPTHRPRVWISADIFLSDNFFSLLLSLWTVLRWSPSNAKQWISQMQLAVASRAWYSKKCYATNIYLAFFVFVFIVLF